MDINNLSLSGIWGLTTTSAIELHNKLGLPLPDNYNLYCLRDNLANFKKGLVNSTVHQYTNEGENSGSRIADSPEHEYEPVDDFSDYSPEPIRRSVRPSCNQTMAVQERLPFFHPGMFSGSAGELVDGFLTRFERAAIVNSWSDDRKKVYFPMYLSDTAAVVFDNLERKHPQLTWEQIKEEFSRTFSPIESKDLLLAKLNARVQLPTESIVQYIADVEKLCALTGAGVDESRICNHVLKGLNPGTLQQISMLDNSTLEKLRANISKYEMSSFMMRQRLGLESPRDNIMGQQKVVGACDREGEMLKRLQSMEQAMERLHVSMVKGAERSERRFPLEDGREETGWGSRRDWKPSFERHQPGWRPEAYYGEQRFQQREPSFERGRQNDSWRTRARSPGHPRSGLHTPVSNYRRRDNSRERSLSRNRTDNNNRGCFRCGSLEHFARGCRKNFQKN